MYQSHTVIQAASGSAVLNQLKSRHRITTNAQLHREHMRSCWHVTHLTVQLDRSRSCHCEAFLWLTAASQIAAKSQHLHLQRAQNWGLMMMQQQQRLCELCLTHSSQHDAGLKGGCCHRHFKASRLQWQIRDSGWLSIHYWYCCAVVIQL